MEGEKQVIIGNSAVGLSAISAIRSIDSSCPITVISAGNCVAYSPRRRITRFWLLLTKAKIWLRI
jgi:hypothetical protein